MTITNPISANQVVDVDLDFKCLTSPLCPTLPTVLQLVIDELCKPEDLTGLDFKCLGTSLTQMALNQSLINKVCETAPGSVGSSTSFVCPTLTYCTSDNWDCDNRDTCIYVINPCNPSETTMCDVVQALLNRNVALSNVARDLCSRLTQAELDINTLKAQVVQIQTTCCNT